MRAPQDLIRMELVLHLERSRVALATTALLLGLSAYTSGQSSGVAASTRRAPEPMDFCAEPGRVEVLGQATGGTAGALKLSMEGAPAEGKPLQFRVLDGPSHGTGLILIGVDQEVPWPLQAFGTSLYPQPPFDSFPFTLDARGESAPLLAVGSVSASLCQQGFLVQAVCSDATAPGGVSFTKAIRLIPGHSASRVPLPGLRQDAVQGFAEVASADIDNDGANDVVGAEYAELHVFRNTGRGLLQSAGHYLVGTSLDALAIGDLDGDADVDVAAATFDGFSTVIGGGDGSFSFGKDFTTGGTPDSIALADFNQDSILDVAIANSDFVFGFLPGDIRLQYGMGDGDFGPVLVLPAGRAPASIAVRDINADGITDLVTANLFSFDASVWLSSGIHGFSFVGNFPTGTTSPQDVAIGDVNGDTILDLVTANVGLSDPNDVALLIGNGDGAFAPARFFTLPGDNGKSIDLGDLTNDGLVDLVVASFNSASVSVLPGLGNGALGAPSTFLAGFEPVSTVVLDLDGNAFSDLIVGSARGVERGELSVFFGREEGIFPQLTPYLTGNAPSGLAVQDINLDQIPDVVVANTNSNSVSVFLGLGDGSLVSMPTVTLPSAFPSPLPTDVEVGDLDGDLVPDLIVGFSSAGNLMRLIGKGDGTFETPVPIPIGLASSPRSLALGDLNGDKLLDVVTVSRGLSCVVLIGNGNGTFAAPKFYDQTTTVAIVELADLDDDQLLDVVFAGGDFVTKIVGVLPGIGGGLLGPLVPVQIPGFADSLCITDVNVDGDLDLIAPLHADDTVVILQGDGGLGFELTHSIPTAVQPLAARAQDMNGDLLPDLLIANSWDGDFSLRMAQTTGGFGPEQIHALELDTTANPFPSHLAIEDLNSDGLPDVVVSLRGGAIGVALNQLLEW